MLKSAQIANSARSHRQRNSAASCSMTVTTRIPFLAVDARQDKLQELGQNGQRLNWIDVLIDAELTEFANVYFVVANSTGQRNTF